MSSVVTAQDLGLTKTENWLKFPPDEHPGWSWKTVAGVDQEDEYKSTTVQLSKVLDGVETGDLTFSQDESGGYVLTGQAAPGIEVA
jgi:hypothetical protein